MPTSFTPPQTPSLGIRVARRGPKHPYFKFAFRVFISDKEIGVQSISPLRLEDPDPIDGEILQTVTLRRAISRDRALFAWRAAIAAGKDDARDVTIVQLAGPEGPVLNIWRLWAAVPLRWDGPDFDAQSDEIAVEEIELTYTKIEWRASV